MTPTSGAHFSS